MTKKEVYWYTLHTPHITKLISDEDVDVVIVGGGIAGLMCAQKLKEQSPSLSISLVEASFCGGGATGKSSGFITPDSELELSDLVHNYGEQEAVRIWEFAKSGVNSIKRTIEKYKIQCDFSEQDSLFIANSKKGFKKVEQEEKDQSKLGYESMLYQKETVEKIIGSSSYEGAIRYKGTFGIIAYLYCQHLKQSLQKLGVNIYEETPVEQVTSTGVKTAHNFITAKNIVICTDRFLPDLHIAETEVYHAQTFLAVSKPLSQENVTRLFPDGPMMVWDTDLIYQYFRIVEGNRLLLGAASLLYTYARDEAKSTDIILRKMKKYLMKKFPMLTVEFEYVWPGLIGVSKDFLPIAGKHADMENVCFAGAGAGLPWACALGEYIADKILKNRDDFDTVFAPNRKFPINRVEQAIISKPLSFAVSHGIKKYLN